MVVSLNEEFTFLPTAIEKKMSSMLWLSDESG